MSAAPEHRPSTAAFVLAFTAIYVIWGSTYLGMRVAVETLPPFAMASARFLVAGSILYLVVRTRGTPAPTGKQWRTSAIVGTSLLLGGNGLVVWAEQYVASGIAALVLGVSPVFMVLTEWAWPGGHRPSPATFLGLALGVVGVLWLAAPWESSTGLAIDPQGFAALLLGCASWSVGSIYSRHVKAPAPPFLSSAMQMLCGGVALAVTAVLAGEFSNFHFAETSARSWTAYAYLTVFGSLIGYSTFVWLMKHTTPARVSTYGYVNPVVAVFLGWLILDEPITPRTLVAAAIIIGGVAIITIQKAHKGR